MNLNLPASQPVAVFTSIFMGATITIEVYKGRCVYVVNYRGDTFRSNDVVTVDEAVTFALAYVIYLVAQAEHENEEPQFAIE